MNPTQIQTTIAPIVAAVAGFLAGRGYFGFDQATWISVLAGLGTLIATIWSAVAARKTAIVTTAANLPEVKAIQLEDRDPKVAESVASINLSTPNNVKVG